MSEVNCPNCTAILSNLELRDGWCDACGQPVPIFAYHQAGLHGPKEKALPRTTAVDVGLQVTDPEESPPVLQLYLVGLAVIGIFAAIVWACL